jgi:hypothetical protein
MHGLKAVIGGFTPRTKCFSFGGGESLRLRSRCPGGRASRRRFEPLNQVRVNLTLLLVLLGFFPIVVGVGAIFLATLWMASA